MKAILFCFCLGCYGTILGQLNEEKFLKEIENFQKEQNEHYFNKETSPLKKKERRNFKGHHFYPVDLSYCLSAKFTLIEDVDTIIMPTSSGTEKMFVRYARLNFDLNGQKCELIAY